MMKPFMLILVLATCLLAACGQTTQAPTTPSEEKPLLSDTDIDNAQLQLAGDIKELVGIEEGIASTGQELASLASVESELSSQAVLPNTSGHVYYLTSIPVLSPDIPGIPSKSCTVSSRVIHHNQATDKRVTFLESCRQIQSVAGGTRGEFVVVSMREWVTPPSGVVNDLEIFLIIPNGLGQAAIFQLTADNVDNTNVSVTPFRSHIVYEEAIAGKATVIIRTWLQSPASYDRRILSTTHPQRHPSISSDGQTIVLVRDPVGSSESIQKYTLATNSYLGVANNIPNRDTLEFPSISLETLDGQGQKVLFLRRSLNSQFQTVVRLKNLKTGTAQTVASGAAIRHPFLTADGRFMVYQDGRNIFAKNLVTGQVQALTNSLTFLFSFYGPTWHIDPCSFLLC